MCNQEPGYRIKRFTPFSSAKYDALTRRLEPDERRRTAEYYNNVDEDDLREYLEDIAELERADPLENVDVYEEDYYEGGH